MSQEKGSSGNRPVAGARPPAPHVKAALSVVQPKQAAGPFVPQRAQAPHVQSAVGTVQARPAVASPALVWPGARSGAAQAKPAPAAIPIQPMPQTLPGPPEGVVQRATNISSSTWNLHKGTVPFGGGDGSIMGEHSVTNTIKARITQQALYHFCTGHTIKHFSFDDDNIDRSDRSTFWPASTTKKQVLAIALGFLAGFDDDIEEKIGEGGRSVLNGSKTHSGVKYTYTITCQADESSFDDTSGLYTDGTAYMTQFYPLSGTGILFAEKANLFSLKTSLGK